MTDGKLWAARSRWGVLELFNVKPRRFIKNEWVGPRFSSIRLSDDLLPEVTFKNSPVEVEIKVKGI